MALKKNPVVWFEIPVNDISRAKTFYEQVFGTELSLNEMGPVKMAWFAGDQNTSGASGSLVKAEHSKPSASGTVIYFSVDDLDGTLKKVQSQHGKTVVPKTSIGEHGFYAVFEDTEGNYVGLHSTK